MLQDIINISTESLPIELKSKKKLIVKGENTISGNKIFFDLEYKKNVKNFLLSFLFNSKMDVGNQEIRFYFRYQDEKNHCIFIFKGGQYIKFSIIGDGEAKIQTSWIKISNGNLFNDKFPFYLSVFEETLTVILDEDVIMNLEHIPEFEGQLGVQFASPKGEIFDLTLDDLNVSIDVLSFEPIIEMPKQSDVFFMQANDFYEQNRYDLAIFYYKKGLLFGKGDDKIYNRVGNLFFLIEEFQNAENYYHHAIKSNPDNPEYKINLGRTLIRLNRDFEARNMLESALSKGSNDPELLIDYASLEMKSGKFIEALEFLEKAGNKSENNFAVLSKMGKCLIELKKIDEGKAKLLEAAKIIMDKDPSSAAIVLKYSIEKKSDLESVRILAQLLDYNHEYKEIYELLKKSQWEFELDNDLLDILINAEIQTGLFIQALDEFKKYSEENMNPKIRYLKAKVLTFTDNIEDAAKEIDILLENHKNSGISINEIIYLKLINLSKSGNLAESENVIKLARKNEPNYEKALEEYAKILVDLEKFNEAVSIFELIKEKIVETPEILYNMGLAYGGVKEYYQARDYLLKAYKSDNNPVIIYALANSLYFTNSFVEALELIQTNRNSLPDNGTIENLAGNIYLAMDNIADAQRYYYKALEIDPENEEYGLNLAESFYKLKDYSNAYMITKQIVKKESMDRAKSLHLRIKTHLYEMIRCTGCYKEWNIPKDAENVDITKEQLEKIPNEAPKGYCPKCKTIYCSNCVKGTPEIDAKCPKCNTVLQYDSPSLKIALDRILRGEND